MAPKRLKAIVIGAGAGGAPAATVLSETWGDGVAIFEAGAHYQAQDFNQLERDMIPRLYAKAGTQGTDDGALSVMQGNCVGGSTVINDAICFRPPPEIVERWRAYGVDIDWAALETNADIVEAAMGVTTIRQDQINRANYLLGLGAAKLGWAGERLRHNSPGCIQCGFRHLGCSYNAKMSMNLSFIPKALDQGAQLFAEIKVQTLRQSGDGWTLATSAGEFTADRVVLAAGVVQTPALLLRSGIDAGTGLQFHLQTVAWGDFSDPVDMHNGIPMSYGVMEFADVYGRSGPGYVIEGVGVQPVPFAVQTNAEGELKAEILARYRHMAGALCLVRSSARGQVRLNKGGEPQLSYDWNEHDAQRLQHFYKRAVELYLAAGAERVLLAHRNTRWTTTVPTDDRIAIGPNRQFLYTAHPFGGACRGDVCDAEGRIKAAKNLWVLDASAFPEALGVNPQITIAALAIEGAEKLQAQAR